MYRSSTPFLSDADRPESSIDLNDAAFATKRWNRSKRARQPFFIIIQIIVALLACLGFFSLVIALLPRSNARLWLPFTAYAQPPNPYYPDTLPPGLTTCDCGHTTTEALSKNCVYDSLAAAWLPPYCRDAALTADFEASGPGPEGQWPYYADEAGKVPITMSEMAALGDTSGSFWALREWHVAHCLFYWQKYTRMKDTGIIMEQRFDHIEHVRHCQAMALKRNPPTDLVEVTVVMNSTLVD